MAWNNPQDEQLGNARKPQSRNSPSGWLRRWWGGRSGGSGGFMRRLTGLLVAVLLAMFLFSTFYRVEQTERALVQRFGKLVRVSEPGLHPRLPWPIETVRLIDVGAEATVPVKARMLTQDVGLVDGAIDIKYRYSEPFKAAFRLRDPPATIGAAGLAALRGVVGRAQLTPLLAGAARSAAAESVRAETQRTLDRYESGVHITSVAFTGMQVPEAVVPVWKTVGTADEEARRAADEARRYGDEILPRARAEAARLLADAESYRQQVVANAAGDADRFTQLAVQYSAAPEVTRNRLYVETMEAIYARSRKVFIDGRGSGNMIYLPLDRLMQMNTGTVTPAGASVSVEAAPEPTGRAAPVVPAPLPADARGGDNGEAR